MLLDEIKKREAREDKEVKHSAAYADVKRLKEKLAVEMAIWVQTGIIILPIALKPLISQKNVVEKVSYVKNYKYEVVNTNPNAMNIDYKLKVYKQDGMKNDLPHWKYVKTVDYGEKKPNVQR